MDCIRCSSISRGKCPFNHFTEAQLSTAAQPLIWYSRKPGFEHSPPTTMLRCFLEDGGGLNCTQGSHSQGNSRAVPLRESAYGSLHPFPRQASCSLHGPTEEAVLARPPALTQTHRYCVIPIECLHLISQPLVTACQDHSEGMMWLRRDSQDRVRKAPLNSRAATGTGCSTENALSLIMNCQPRAGPAELCDTARGHGKIHDEARRFLTNKSRALRA